MSTDFSPSPASSFRRRLIVREHLVGTFIKTPTSHSIEILGALGFDFVVIDAEHAPFDRASIDVALLAARAVGTAGLVRVAEPTAAAVLSVLDCGATGLLVPHVTSAAKAKEIVAMARYRGGRRGYSGSPRAAGYGGGSMWNYIDQADATTVVIAMIEDPEGVEDIDAITAVDGLDALFIGRGDLTVALGATSNTAPAVQSAVERVTAAAAKLGKPLCVMVGGATEAAALQQLGATAFIVSSDQGLMRRAAAEEIRAVAALSSSQA